MDKPIVSKFVGDATTDELLTEIKRRKDEEIAARYAARNKRLEGITIEEANRFIPNHATTSCSDINTCNGFSANRRPRCSRCALIQIIEDGVEAADNMDVTFYLDFDVIEP